MKLFGKKQGKHELAVKSWSIQKIDENRLFYGFIILKTLARNGHPARWGGGLGEGG